MIKQFHFWVLSQRKQRHQFEKINKRTSMYIAVLFTTAKIWKQPKCPSLDEWIKKMWHIYTMENYSAIKKNEIMPFAAI